MPRSATCARAALTLRKRAQSIGVSVNETNSDIMIATATVTPKLLKKRPTWPSMNATGRKMTTSDRVVASTARLISPVAGARRLAAR